MPDISYLSQGLNNLLLEKSNAYLTIQELDDHEKAILQSIDSISMQIQTF